MVEKRYVNTAIILIDQKRRRINHKPNASSGRLRLWPGPVEERLGLPFTEFYEKLEAFMRRLAKRGPAGRELS